jgi:hypothetical protein
MRDCDHVGHRVYARRVFANGTVHFCVQCLVCLRTLKLDDHGGRPWIRVEEVPAGRKIHDFIEREDAQ